VSRHPDEVFGAPHEQLDEQARPPKRKIGALSKVVNVQRLRDAMDESKRAIKPFIDKHVSAVKLTAGNRYGASEHQKSPINMMRLAVSIWLRQLISQTPRSLVIPRTPDLKVAAYELQLALDYLLREIRFGPSISACVRSAIFSMGIMKVGITSKYLHEASGFLADAGQPFAEPVLMEDWLHDMSARRREEWDWCGNKYKLPYEAVMENPDFSAKVKNKLVVDGKSQEYSIGESDARTSDMSMGSSLNDTEYRDHVELWDIWIPGDHRFVTLPVQSGLGVLQERDWAGPENGPFHLLGFFQLPGNVMPIGPAQSIFDLQELITVLFAKLGEQGTAQKTIVMVDGQAESDGSADAILKSRSFDMVRVGHSDGIKEVRMGGVDADTLSLVQWLKEMASYVGGNVDTVGGLTTQSETVGQERLLAATSSEFIRDMQTQVTDFTTDILSDLGEYLYGDPASELKLTKQINGYGDIPFVWGPENRQDGVFNFNFSVQPYSLKSKGPQERMSTLTDLMMKILMPLAPQMAEWGVSLRLDKFLEYFSRYADLPELEDIIQMAEATPTQQAGSGGVIEKRRPLQAPVTSRENVRTNRTEESAGQKANDLVTTLAAGGKNRPIPKPTGTQP